MSEYLLASELEDVIEDAISSGQTTSLALMERRGQAVVDAVMETWPEFDRKGRSAVVLCGPGNNGGDGFVTARLLHQRGWLVEVYLYGKPNDLPPDAKKNMQRWQEYGSVGYLLDDFNSQISWRSADLAVDALFGSGINRALPELVMVLFNLDDATDIFAEPLMRDSPDFAAPRVVAIDLPSGITPDTGEFYLQPEGGQGAASANLTVTFHRKRRGHRLAVGPVLAGQIIVKDIGL